MSITDFTFNNTHFQVKMVKKIQNMFFFSIFQHGLQPCPINNDKLFAPGFIGFGDKKSGICTKNKTSQIFDPTLQWGKRFRGS